MGNNVYVNGRAIACKVAEGKSVAAFPDVCLSPPPPPAGPVPVPYPNTGFASDTADGSKSVKIGGKPVMLKDKSHFKKSVGDEASTKSFGMGVVTHQHGGKVYFASWSFTVKVEGENAVRAFDLTTHNHGSAPPNTPPWPYLDAASPPDVPWDKRLRKTDPCAKDVKRERKACKDHVVWRKNGTVNRSATRKNVCGKKKGAAECREAQKCKLMPYSKAGCCPGFQAHHIVEAHAFYESGGRGATLIKAVKRSGYVDDDAPCVCALGPRHDKEHGKFHAFVGQLERAYHLTQKGWTLGEATQAGVKAQSVIYPDCNPKCIEKQLNAYHQKKCGISKDTMLRTDPLAGTRSAGKLTRAEAKALNKELNVITSGAGGVA